MRVVPSHRLGDAERYAQVNPELEVPPRSYRDHLEHGDLVMLFDELPDEPEPFWVELDEVLGPGWYLGVTKSGEPVEFNSSHVADLSGPRFGMGARWYDVFSPDAPPPAPEPEPRKEGSAFDVFKPKPGKGVRGFFDIFRRRPAESFEPIPPEERRGRSQDFPKLEPPPVIRLPYHGPVEPEEEEFEEEFEEEPIPEMDVPPPSAPAGPMAVASTGDLPDDLFSVLEEEAAPQGGLIITQEAPPPPPSMSIAPASALPDNLFDVLPPETPSTAIVPAAERGISTGIPANLFDVLEPEERGLAMPGELSPFNVLAPEEPKAGMVVREERGVGQSLFDVLPPGPPPPLPPPPPKEETIFSEEEIRREVEREKKRKPTAKKKATGRMPSVQDWVAWIKDTYKLSDLWKYIETERNSEEFAEAQENNAEGGDAQPTAPLEVWHDWDWGAIFKFFGIPESTWRPYSDAIEKAEEKDGYADEEWESFRIDFLGPMDDNLSAAFDEIKPKSIPGSFVLGDDYEDGGWGLFYYEPLPEEEAKKRRAKAGAARQAEEKAAREWEKEKKAELRKIWGKMPNPEDLVPWIEAQYDIDKMFRDIQKTRKTRQWKETVKDYGDAQLPLEVIADLGPKKRKDYEYDIAAYFGIPPEVVTLYERSNSGQELWEDVFWPFFAHLEEAFDMLLPSADLPGRITVEEDQDDQLVIQYVDVQYAKGED